MNEGEVLNLLRRRYPPPQWFFLPHVRNGTGFTSVPRTMDAFAFSLWPSRGLEMMGFEVKCYRADWLRELKDPAKADAFNDFVDYWFVVAPRGIIHVEEVPRTWGFLEVINAKTVRVKKQPIADPHRGGKMNLPGGFHRGFLAAILQRFEGRFVPKEQVDIQVNAARESGKHDGRMEIKFKQDDHDELIKAVKMFEGVSGIKIDRYDPERTQKMGKLLRALLEKGPDHFKQAAENHRAALRRELTEVDRYLTSLKEFTVNPSQADLSHL